MHGYDFPVSKALGVATKTFLQSTHRSLFLLLDHREDDVGLSAFGQLLIEEVVDSVHLALALVVGLDRLTSRGELVNDGDIEISVERHRQRTWDRRGAHDEDMGMEALPLLPESRALDDPEAVLLVDDG